jgi:hypothetical protein
MKKTTTNIAAVVSLLLFGGLFTSCKKDVQSQDELIDNNSLANTESKLASKSKNVPFKASMSTWYRISPTAPSPVSVNGMNYTTFAYVPGGGEGNATHMGSVKTYYNQLAYTSDITAPVPAPVGSINAAAVDVINYPVILPFLPFIQPGEFASLSAISASLNIPQQINGKIITSLLFNSKGDAVFISNSTPSVITPVNPNRNEFSGKALIVGGRGKFANASGEVDFKGFFNPNNPNEADYSMDGWISY